MVSANSLCSYAKLAQAWVSPDQLLFFQLYKNKNNDTAQVRVKYVEELGYKAMFLTVDAVVMSNCERDIKAKPGNEDEKADVHAAQGGSLANLMEEVDEVEVLDLSGVPLMGWLCIGDKEAARMPVGAHWVSCWWESGPTRKAGNSVKNFQTLSASLVWSSVSGQKGPAIWFGSNEVQTCSANFAGGQTLNRIEHSN